MSWTGKESFLAVTFAPDTETWNTAQTPAAGDGIKVNKINVPFGTPELTVDETTDTAWATYINQNSINPVEYSLEIEPRFSSSASTPYPVEEMLMACYAFDTDVELKTASSANAWLHYGHIVSNHALSDTISKWFSITGATVREDDTLSTLTLKSWQPTGFTWTSEAGNPVKLTVKGIGSEVLKDDSTIIAAMPATYLDVARKVWHYHLCVDQYGNADAGEGGGGCWLAKRTATSDAGAQTANFTGQYALIHPSFIEISVDRKMEGFHTDCRYTSQPIDNGFAEVKVKLKFPVWSDDLDDGASKGVAKVLKDWEDDTEGYFHMKARWSFGTHIEVKNDMDYYPYYEFGFAKLRPISIVRDIEAGKVIGFECEFQALAPTASTALPSEFQKAGSRTGSGVFDTFYFAVCNYYDTALITDSDGYG